ncbi:uncharacterized protein LOC127848836 [Dreissena polymorpha]|uniref:DUF4773 domain-containing protein n=1 Tax=Dreissena polymorpha TaxID=45954 RepID=A0A9D4DBQ6_DREPO|nr:uncharacterized protein LOC127848836 [Dreissena polymorpha]KAH3746702.1 hypothetical protein DPMN_181113 [Dreissena polymorpha]
MSTAFYFAVLVGVGLMSTRYVTCFTNKDFLYLAIANGAEIESDDASYNATQNDDDVIDLPGEWNDDLDVAYLIAKLGERSNNDETDIDLTNVGDIGSGCSCRRYSCGCCVGKSFRVKIWRKRIRFSFKGCITLTYLPRHTGFRLTITFNGRRVFKREISLRHPPRLCYGVPGLRWAAKVCLELYNINLAQRQVCARLVGRINLRIKKFRLRLKLGCFRIPILSEAMLAKITDDDRMDFGPMPKGLEAMTADIADDERLTFDPVKGGNFIDEDERSEMTPLSESKKFLSSLKNVMVDVESVEKEGLENDVSY